MSRVVDTPRQGGYYHVDKPTAVLVQVALDSLCPSDLRRPVSFAAGRRRRGGRPGYFDPRQFGSGRSRPDRGTDADRIRPEGRVVGPNCHRYVMGRNHPVNLPPLAFGEKRRASSPESDDQNRGWRDPPLPPTTVLVG
jgi:hypothetical protein